MIRFAANVSMLFTELPFAERFDAAVATGFEGRRALVAAGRAGAVRLRGRADELRRGDIAAGERGIVNDPPRWRAHVPVAVSLARLRRGAAAPITVLVEAARRSHRDLIAHVQVADHPGRTADSLGWLPTP